MSVDDLAARLIAHLSQSLAQPVADAVKMIEDGGGTKQQRLIVLNASLIALTKVERSVRSKISAIESGQ